MSFVLPGNARSLRFTGEAKALSDAPPKSAEASPASALGKPRVRKQTPKPQRANPIPPVTKARDLYRPPFAGPINAPVVRHKDADDDESPTTAMDRGQLEGLPPRVASTFPVQSTSRRATGPLSSPSPHVMPPRSLLPPSFPPGSPSSAPPGAASAPIPNFRSASELPTAARTSPQSAMTPGNANAVLGNGYGNTGSAELKPSVPYAVWVLASIVVAVLSYHITPALFARFL